MKISSATANPNTSPREVAQGCFTTNLAVPGLGSVVGGRKIGYLQMAIYFSGLAVSLIFGIRFIFWSLAHWTEVHNPNIEDPLAPLRAIWHEVRLPFLGIILCGIALLWALSTSHSLLADAKRKEGAH